MLTNLKEGKKIKCQPYWPESGKKKFGPFTVTITDQQVLADYTIRSLQAKVRSSVVHLVSLTVPCTSVGWRSKSSQFETLPFHCLAGSWSA